MIYAVCGVGIEDQQTLVIATICSGTVPLLLALAVRRWLLRQSTEIVAPQNDESVD
jgi:hypothetical protein